MKNDEAKFWLNPLFVMQIDDPQQIFDKDMARLQLKNSV